MPVMHLPSSMTALKYIGSIITLFISGGTANKRTGASNGIELSDPGDGFLEILLALAKKILVWIFPIMIEYIYKPQVSLERLKANKLSSSILCELTT